MCTVADASIADQSLLHKCASPGVGRYQEWRIAALAETAFDLFITSDQNIRYQQNLAGRNIAVLELSTNDIERIQAAASLIQAAVEEIQPMEFKRLEIP